MGAAQTRFYSVVMKAAEALRAHSDKALIASAGVTAPQAAVMAILIETPEATQSDIADVLGLSEPAVTQMVARLQRDGFVLRERDGCDRRRWRLMLTETGRESARKARAAFDPINAIIDDALGETSVAEVAAQLEALTRKITSSSPN